jgi:hypothetical protein
MLNFNNIKHRLVGKEHVYINPAEMTPDADGNVSVYETVWHKERKVPAIEVKSAKKYIRGILKDCYFNGYYTDEKGVTWEVWSPIHSELSAWARLESDGRRTKMIYDPGNHWRSTLEK